MEAVNYRLFGWLRDAPRVARARESSVGQRLVRWFRRCPFAVVWASAVLPFPFGLTRVCALLAGYPLTRHLSATALGRFPRYWLCAAAAAAAPAGDGALLGACAAIVAASAGVAALRLKSA